MFWRVGSYVFVVMLMTACSSSVKDKGIKQMITTMAKEDIAFAAVSYAVDKGVVTLNGTCATPKESADVESRVKQTSGVRQVINQIAIAPVTLNGEHLLKKAVDSVLMDYPSILA